MTDRKASNRAAFPFAASIVDELRKLFGEGVTVIFASENGREVGKQSVGNGVVAVAWTRAEEIRRRARGR